MYIIRKDTTPGSILKIAMVHFDEVQKGLRVAKGLYDRCGDSVNSASMDVVIELVDRAYNELGSIYYND